MIFLVISMTGCDGNNPNGDRINPYKSKESIMEAIKGKWSSNDGHNDGSCTFYRFEITDSEVKCWRVLSLMQWGDKSSFKAEPDEIVTYSIGGITSDEEGYKELVIAQGEKMGKLTITANKENERGYFIQKKSNYNENTMFHDWEH